MVVVRQSRTTTISKRVCEGRSPSRSHLVITLDAKNPRLTNRYISVIILVNTVK